MAYVINLVHHFFYSTEWLALEAIFSFIHQFFFEKYLNFLCFSICSSFGRQLCQNCGSAGSEPYVRSHITESSCFHMDIPVVYLGPQPDFVSMHAAIHTTFWSTLFTIILFQKQVVNWLLERLQTMAEHYCLWLDNKTL